MTLDGARAYVGSEVVYTPVYVASEDGIITSARSASVPW